MPGMRNHQGGASILERAWHGYDRLTKETEVERVCNLEFTTAAR